MVTEEFATLAHTARSKLVSVARRILGNEADAEDAVQRALLNGWHAVGKFTHEASLYTWLYTILVHECLSILRRRQRVERSGLAVEKEYYRARDLDPEQVCMRNQLQQVLHHEIRRLPRIFRDITLADLATTEARDRKRALGAMMGLDPLVAASRRDRARKCLRDRMEPHLTL